MWLDFNVVKTKFLTQTVQNFSKEKYAGTQNFGHLHQIVEH